MSGICGILANGPNKTQYVDALQDGLDAIAHRGRDGISCYNDDHVFVGHRLFDTGCNGFAVDPDGYIITFDGRLDNRNALCAKLRTEGAMKSPSFDNLNDTRLLLLAYRHFGAELPKHLLGDFAIGIWDPADQAVFLCRDHFGIRPLFYQMIAGDLFFASEIKALHAMAPHAGLSAREEAIVAFANGTFEFDNPASCIFENINRLLPGHCATIRNGEVVTDRYWLLDPELPIPMDDVPGQFKALFVQAIGRRLRGTVAIAATLSGGVDSSSIVSTIGSEFGNHFSDMEVFSMLFDDQPGADERDYIAAVKDKFDFRYHSVDMSAVSALGTADEIIAEQDKPHFGPNGAVSRWFLNYVAKQTDAKIVLYGHGGDEVASDGHGIFDQLAASGQWIQLWNELTAIKSLIGRRIPYFRKLVWRRGIRPYLGLVFKRFKQVFSGPPTQSPRDYIRESHDLRPRPAEQIIHLQKLTSPVFGEALEIKDHDAAFAGVELRMPFMDVELAEFCVKVEATNKCHNGVPRKILRDAMIGILPEKVRCRNTKHDFAAHLRITMLRDDFQKIDEALFVNGNLIAPYLNLAELRSDWTEYKSSGSAENVVLLRIWRAVMLSRWLAKQASRLTDMLEPEPMLLAAE